MLNTTQTKQKLTGVEGFEPTDGGVKVHSLTTWRHPKTVSNTVK
jgi:hypothetical protein